MQDREFVGARVLHNSTTKTNKSTAKTRIVKTISAPFLTWIGGGFVEPTQWFQLAGAVVGFLALGVNAYKALNRKSGAYEQAANSLSLAKALAEVDLPEEDLRRIEERKVLREGLLDRAYFYSQLYSSATQPVLESQWQAGFLVMVGISTVISQSISPLTGSLGDEASQVALIALPMTFFVAAYFVSLRVTRNKTVLKNLREPARPFYPQAAPRDDNSWGRLHELLLHAHENRARIAAEPATDPEMKRGV